VVTATTKTGRQREPKHFDAAYAKVRFFEVMLKRNRKAAFRAPRAKAMGFLMRLLLAQAARKPRKRKAK
jgi:hypothetical protein